MKATIETTARTKTGIEIPVMVKVLSNGRLKATADGHACDVYNEKINIDAATVKALLGIDIPTDRRADISLIENIEEKIGEARTWIMHNTEVCIHYDSHNQGDAYSISVDGEVGLFGNVRHIFAHPTMIRHYGNEFQKMADVRRDIGWWLWANRKEDFVKELNIEYDECGIFRTISFKNMPAFEELAVKVLEKSGRTAELNKQLEAAAARKAKKDAEREAAFEEARRTGEEVVLSSYRVPRRGYEAQILIVACPDGTTRERSIKLN